MTTLLRSNLLENYTKHYIRVNKTIKKANDKGYKSFVKMYGNYLSDLPHGSRVLDVGCGTGLLLQYLLRYNHIKIAGVDISPKQIDLARKNMPNVELHCEDALEFLKTNPNTFSGIFCTDVLEHMETKDHCYNLTVALRMALVPGGFCIVRTPNAANLTGCYSRYMDLTHERSFTRTSLIQLMEASGFESVTVIPVASGHFTGNMRLWIESAIHRIVFRTCGHGMESVFTSNIIVAGRKSPK